MRYFYEKINRQPGRFVNAYIHSVNEVEMHWHDEMEILLVLEGSINIRLNNRLYLLQENDLILINPNEIHNIFNSQEQNVLLAVQVNMKNLQFYYPGVNRRAFTCNSCYCGKDKQEQYDVIRRYLAKIVWEINKNEKGYEFAVGSYISLLVRHLVNNFEYNRKDNEEEEINADIQRLQRIVSYINKSLDSRVTLAEIARREELSVSYLSRFIKESLGVSFQQYMNAQRMDKAVSLLLGSKQNITDIAYASGFPSTKSFYKLFKNTKGCTPTEFREKNTYVIYDMEKSQIKREGVSPTYLDVDRRKALKKLFSYLNLEKITDVGSQVGNVDEEVLIIDGKSGGTPYIKYWKKLTTFSRAAEGLRHNWRLQFRELQREVGFEHVRFHGIFCDEMMICNIDETDHITYNWSYVDELFDFLQQIDIKPFVELSFMPTELKSSDETMYWWKANVSRPKDIEQWNNLVIAFIKHCINRYGLKEVETWYFEVWNEPDFEHTYWIGNKQDYFEFYKETAYAVKSVHKNLKVGGPAIVQQSCPNETWLEEFLTYCHNNNLPLDFVSFHIYTELFDETRGGEKIIKKTKEGMHRDEILKEWTNEKRIYHDENHTYDSVKQGNRVIRKTLPYKPELHITEWNASSYNRNLIHDTCFVAAYIVSNVIRCLGEMDSLGYWLFSDIQEESKAGISPFHGGFGLMSKDGLKKPSYFAYYLLGKLGDHIIDHGSDYMVTKTGDDIQVIFCNYAYFDNLFLSGDISALTYTNRYAVYEAKPDKEIEVNVRGLTGAYKVARYMLNREHGSVFDKWVEMGAPENMTQEEIRYLQGVAYPKMDVTYIDVNGVYEEKMQIPVHGVGLITLEKQL